MLTAPDFDHFASAQDAVWPVVVAELRAGKKAAHWIWYVFPQIEGLGQSAMSHRFAIASLDEARAYFDEPLLKSRLLEATGLMLEHRGTDVEDMLGWLDAKKFHASMTLFSRATGEDCFKAALDGFFAGKEHVETVQLLA